MKFKQLSFIFSVLLCTSAYAQNSTVANHAFAVGKGPAVSGLTSLLCASAQLAVGQAAADPVCQTISGDATLSAAGALTLGTVNANVGSFGSASQCAAVTVNAKGLITAASQVACSIPTTALTGTLQAAQEPAHTGDVTNTAGSLAMTLGTVNSNVGAFGSTTQCPTLTVNAKGLITAASQAACASGSGNVSNVGTPTNGQLAQWTGATTIQGIAAGQIPGTATNNNASAGNVGEYVESVVLGGSAVTLASGTPKDITSISLTAGDWDVSGVCVTSPGVTTTQSAGFCWSSATSITFPTVPNEGAYAAANYTTGAAASYSIAQGPGRFSLAGTTTIFLSTVVNFATSTDAAYGIIRARRVR